MKRFVTLFEKTSNEILMKDVGLIPYFMMHDFKYCASLATCRMSGTYSYLDEYLKGFEVDFFTPVLGSNWLGAVFYLLKNAKHIDILNIYHLKLQTYVLFWIYSHINKEGKTYLKLDIDQNAIEKNDPKLQRYVYIRFLKKVDYCTVESTVMQQMVLEKYGVKVDALLNGYYDFDSNVNIPKQNVFLTVGRLGTPQKATDVLLEAFEESADDHDWKLILVGSIEDDFKPYITRYFCENPKLRDRVIFTGKITNKQELKKYYEMAKVFVLPSRWESFGLVLLEAMFSGDYLIGTDRIPPMVDFIHDGQYGVITKSDSVSDLAKALVKSTKREYTESSIADLKNYAMSNYSWNAGCKKILQGLGEI